ncbi:hypothetical protein [Halobacterium sp. R2-5]|uniref:hypothetical protein n=1 Tax=Halobacterium sp. R2-5 TaxID=2715751 RepID=UPI0014225615|nr:hypothetical protein [Halobacterium sp. R2-5]NIB98056.1 hypothetical protein [Halobacterium sp. R2-5]
MNRVEASDYVEFSRLSHPAVSPGGDRIERIARWFDGYSDHHDAERALDRPRNDGLGAGDGSDETDNERE